MLIEFAKCDAIRQAPFDSIRRKVRVTGSTVFFMKNKFHEEFFMVFIRRNILPNIILFPNFELRIMQFPQNFLFEEALEVAKN